MTFIEHSSNQEDIEKIKKDGLPVLIFGAGIVGEALFCACRDAGIEVECFCDNNINKVGSLIFDVDVIHVQELRKRYDDAIFLISAADIKDVVYQLNGMEYSRWYPSGLLLRDIDLSLYQLSAPADFVEFAVSTCLLCHDSYLNSDKLFLRSIDIIITERCSLKCRDCSNLMQYYKRPQDCSIEEIAQSIDAFCTLVDEVNEFRVIGGEPFMNREIHMVIKRLIDEPKVRKIVIYTNGTIAPREEHIEYLKNNKVLVLITDYGLLARKLNAVKKTLQNNNIAYYTMKVTGWTDCAGIMRHYRSPEQQREIFKSCCAKNLITLSKGRLYRCPYAANAARLMVVPDYGGDYIDIVRESNMGTDIYEMKERIRTFLLHKDFLESCDFCNGRPFSAPEIEPAIQIDKPLDYERYS
ncbi:radical SAM protein [Thermodesulfobacteriota bacterium]